MREAGCLPLLMALLGPLLQGVMPNDQAATLEPAPTFETATAQGLPVAPPDAVILFDGLDTSAWQHADGGDCRWLVVDDALEVTPGEPDLVTRESFGSFQLHLEFRVPSMPDATGQARGNSGIYLHSRYELQILDSYGIDPPQKNDCGAIYTRYAPLVNACRPPETWQTYDIFFEAPKLTDGKLVEPVHVSVLQNGLWIQHDVTLDQPTGSAKQQPMTETGPIRLQNHGNPVRYRHIWIRELTAAPE